MMKTRNDKERIWLRDVDGSWKKPTSTHRYPRLKLFIIAVLLLFFIFWFWYSISRAAAAPQLEPFNHDTCQYPDRTTNPADGCDNSDPCDPATTKGGSGACLPQQPTPQTDVTTQLDNENLMSHNIETAVLK